MQPRRHSHAVGVERVHDLGRLLINAGDFGADWRVWLCGGGVKAAWRWTGRFSHHSRSLVPTRSNKRLAVSLPTSNTTHRPASTDISTVKLASPPPVMPFKDVSSDQSASVKSTLYLLTRKYSTSASLTLAFVAFVAFDQLVCPIYGDLRNEAKQ